jgi:hypothetical protein
MEGEETFPEGERRRVFAIRNVASESRALRLSQGGTNMRSALRVTLIGVFMLTLSSGYAVANANAALYYTRGTTHGIKYMDGGVGINERAAMDRLAKDYDLKLVFAEPSGPYLANVSVAIENARGKTLMQSTDNGPWFFAKLPDGKYRVAATFNGKKEVREVEIGQPVQTVTEAQPVKTEAKKMEAGKSLQTLAFYWKD